MDRFSYPSPVSLRNTRRPQESYSYPQVVPFGPRGGGQWTAHPIGFFIAIGFVLIALVGIPGSFFFLVTTLGLGTVLGCALRLWHRSKGF